MALTAQVNGLVKKSRGTRPPHANMFGEAKELQALLFASAKGKRLKPIERSALARVWKELGEFRLRLQGKGPPKAVDYGSRKTRQKPSKPFTYAPVVAQDTPTGSAPDKAA